MGDNIRKALIIAAVVAALTGSAVTIIAYWFWEAAN